jgi:1-acyl-sn-glycerol-3-phosphate acyltransferase
MATLSAGVRLGAITLLFAATIPPYLALRKIAPKRALQFSLPVFRAASWLLGASVRTLGNAPEIGPCLVVANHISWVDIVLISSVTPCAFVAKSDIADWPIFGTLARAKQSLFVERTKPGATASFKQEMKGRLEEGGILVLFAEGTSSDGNRVLPFKSALLSAVEQTDVPVQPLTIAYTGQGGLPMGRRRRPLLAWYGDMDLVPHLWEVLKRGPFEAELRFHPSLSARGFENRKALSCACEDIVRGGLVTSLYRRSVRCIRG